MQIFLLYLNIFKPCKSWHPSECHIVKEALQSLVIFAFCRHGIASSISEKITTDNNFLARFFAPHVISSLTFDEKEVNNWTIEFEHSILAWINLKPISVQDIRHTSNLFFIMKLLYGSRDHKVRCSTLHCIVLHTAGCWYLPGPSIAAISPSWHPSAAWLLG